MSTRRHVQVSRHIELRTELAFLRLRFCKPVSKLELSRMTDVEPQTIRRIVRTMEAIEQAGQELPETWKDAKALAKVLG
ncbi:hypothetical protein [Thiorhodococcus fuscus]|uniref:Uncharacterized protein n=1 Tax=Thiorhodococcus fuscus TaxID=527200 RepID=A0ABW4Y4R7_9GAMM